MSVIFGQKMVAVIVFDMVVLFAVVIIFVLLLLSKLADSADDDNDDDDCVDVLLKTILILNYVGRVDDSRSLALARLIDYNNDDDDDDVDNDDTDDNDDDEVVAVAEITLRIPATDTAFCVICSEQRNAPLPLQVTFELSFSRLL
uniref:Uncharacterized protein n=1 Tax=Glossina palpalis gambiensis TaxID=67801 RepID=A0A1B0C0Y1_9MUSC